MNTMPAVKKNPSMIRACFGCLCRLLGWVCLGVMVSLTVSMGLLYLKGTPDGLLYLAKLCQGPLHYLNAIAPVTYWMHDPASIAWYWGNTAYQWVLVKTHALNVLHQAKTNMYPMHKLIRYYLQTGHPVLQAFIMTVQLIGIRLAVLVMSLPFFLLLGVIGWLDGLSQRSIRRLSGGFESAMTYHHAKSFIPLALILGSLFYLVLPVNVAPIVILLPFTLLFGGSIQLTVKSFKKYF